MKVRWIYPVAALFLMVCGVATAAEAAPAVAPTAGSPWWTYLVAAIVVPLVVQLVRHLSEKIQHTKIVKKFHAEKLVDDAAEALVRALQTMQKNSIMSGTNVRNVGIEQLMKDFAIPKERASLKIDAAYDRVKEAAAAVPFPGADSSSSEPPS